MGDSVIIEIFGIGGVVMIVVSGVMCFVGVGGMEVVRVVFEEMVEIYFECNMQLQILSWDFQGVCLGLDICCVVEIGIMLFINIGIVYKEVGIGQIGVGIVWVLLVCFEQVLEVLVESMGIG